MDRHSGLFAMRIQALNQYDKEVRRAGERTYRSALPYHYGGAVVLAPSFADAMSSSTLVQDEHGPVFRPSRKLSAVGLRWKLSSVNLVSHPSNKVDNAWLVHQLANRRTFFDRRELDENKVTGLTPDSYVVVQESVFHPESNAVAKMGPARRLEYVVPPNGSGTRKAYQVLRRTEAFDAKDVGAYVLDARFRTATDASGDHLVCDVVLADDPRVWETEESRVRTCIVQAFGSEAKVHPDWERAVSEIQSTDAACQIAAVYLPSPAHPNGSLQVSTGPSGRLRDLPLPPLFAPVFRLVSNMPDKDATADAHLREAQAVGPFQVHSDVCGATYLNRRIPFRLPLEDERCVAFVSHTVSTSLLGQDGSVVASATEALRRCERRIFSEIACRAPFHPMHPIVALSGMTCVAFQNQDGMVGYRAYASVVIRDPTSGGRPALT